MTSPPTPWGQPGVWEPPLPSCCPPPWTSLNLPGGPQPPSYADGLHPEVGFWVTVSPKSQFLVDGFAQKSIFESRCLPKVNFWATVSPESQFFRVNGFSQKVSLSDGFARKLIFGWWFRSKVNFRVTVSLQVQILGEISNRKLKKKKLQIWKCVKFWEIPYSASLFFRVGGRGRSLLIIWYLPTSMMLVY